MQNGFEWNTSDVLLRESNTNVQLKTVYQCILDYFCASEVIDKENLWLRTIDNHSGGSSNLDIERNVLYYKLIAK